MSISVASQKDAKVVYRIARRSPFTANLPANLEECLKRGEVALWWEGAECVGFVLVYNCIARPYTSLYDMGVLPEWQGRGVGRALLAWAENQAVHPKIRLSVDVKNEQAKSFWISQGFHIIGKKLAPRKRVELLLMEKQLRRQPTLL